MTVILLKNQSDALPCPSNITGTDEEYKLEELAEEYAEYQSWVALYEEKYGKEDAIDTKTENYWRDQAT
jgi:3-methyladenine DNA glycosylase/8-oxoguanine DNA glycosylase